MFRLLLWLLVRVRFWLGGLLLYHHGRGRVGNACACLYIWLVQTEYRVSDFLREGGKGGKT